MPITHKIAILTVLFGLFTSSCAAQGHRIIRKDCELSFTDQPNLRYVPIESPNLSSDTICIIAFSRDPKVSETESTIGQNEGWKELVDYTLEVKKESLQDASQDAGIALYADGSAKLTSNHTSGGVSFKEDSSKTIPIKNGSVVLIEATATNRTPSMVRIGTRGQRIFLAGNATRSISYTHWISSKNKISSKDADIITEIFKSLEFFESREEIQPQD